MYKDYYIFNNGRLKRKDNTLYLNPGSISIPRGVDYRSFIILDINDGKVSINEIRV